MKMPLEPIENSTFAPCGMNCPVCYKHCHHNKPCAGCLKNCVGKPKHCRQYQIKDCCQEKGLTYCYQCSQFPCPKIKRLKKSYQHKYGVSLLANSQQVKEKGLTAFMAAQKLSYTCPVCGGVISLHDADCSECHLQVE